MTSFSRRRVHENHVRIARDRLADSDTMQVMASECLYLATRELLEVEQSHGHFRSATRWMYSRASPCCPGVNDVPNCEKRIKHRKGWHIGKRVRKIAFRERIPREFDSPGVPAKQSAHTLDERCLPRSAGARNTYQLSTA